MAYDDCVAVFFFFVPSRTRYDDRVAFFFLLIDSTGTTATLHLLGVAW